MRKIQTQTQQHIFKHHTNSQGALILLPQRGLEVRGPRGHAGGQRPGDSADNPNRQNG